MSYDDGGRVMEWALIVFGVIIYLGALLVVGVIAWGVWKIVT